MAQAARARQAHPGRSRLRTLSWGRGNGPPHCAWVHVRTTERNAPETVSTRRGFHSKVLRLSGRAHATQRPELHHHTARHPTLPFEGSLDARREHSDHHDRCLSGWPCLKCWRRCTDGCVDVVRKSLPRAIRARSWRPTRPEDQRGARFNGGVRALRISEGLVTAVGKQREEVAEIEHIAVAVDES